MSPGRDTGAGTVPGESEGTQGFEDAKGCVAVECEAVALWGPWWRLGIKARMEMLLFGL